MISSIFFVLLCGLPFSYLLFNQVDIWHANGHWFQLGILALIACSLIEKPRHVHTVNKPLAITTLWFGLLTAYYWYESIVKTKNYAILLFFPFFNFLCFVLFYKFSCEYLWEKEIKNILKLLSYSVLGVLFYCVLQVLKLDQFFTALDTRAVDELVGTIGNTAHLSGYLAICQPLFFKKSRFNILCLILLWVILLMCKSFSGIFTAICVILFWLFMTKQYKKIWFGLSGLGLVTIPLVINHTFFTQFLSDSGRFKVWKIVFDVFKKRPITGYGLGIVNALKINISSSTWRHLHQEYYQIAIETGIIGLVLVLWCIWEYFKLVNSNRNELTLKLASIFFGFCVLALFTFNCHLWLLASMGMMGYSFIYALKGEHDGSYHI